MDKWLRRGIDVCWEEGETRASGEEKLRAEEASETFQTFCRSAFLLGIGQISPKWPLDPCGARRRRGTPSVSARERLVHRRAA